MVVGSTFVKIAVRAQDNADGDISIQDEARIGLNNVFNYMIR